MKVWFANHRQRGLQPYEQNLLVKRKKKRVAAAEPEAEEEYRHWDVFVDGFEDFLYGNSQLN